MRLTKLLKLDWSPCGDEGEDKDSATVLGLRLVVEKRSRSRRGGNGGWDYYVFESGLPRSDPFVKMVEEGEMANKRLAKLAALKAALQHLRILCAMELHRDEIKAERRASRKDPRFAR